MDYEDEAPLMDDLDEAEVSMFRAWLKEQKEQQQGKPWPKWMFAADTTNDKTRLRSKTR